MIYNNTSRVINEATFRLLAENGFEKLTYQKIASECGIDRALVQYYFPKKHTIAQSFWIYIWDLAAEYVASINPPVEARKASVWILRLHYCFLVSTEKLRSLTLEIIDSRHVTDGISDLVTERNANLVGTQPDEERMLFLRNTNRKLTGAFLDDLFHKLSLHEPVSGESIATDSVRFFLSSDRLAEEEIEQFLRENEMPDDELQKGIAYIADSLGIDHPVLTTSE